MITIREHKKSDIPQIKEISDSLHPKWFTKEALDNILLDIQLNKTFILQSDGVTSGFISLYSQDGIAHVSWLGILLSEQNKGLGTKLLKFAEDYLKNIGIEVLKVKTVVEQIPPDQTYDLTIKFYSKNGYKIEKKFPEKTYEGFKFKIGIFSKNLR